MRPIRVVDEADRLLDDITFGLVVKDEFESPVFEINNLVIPSPPMSSAVRSGLVVCRLPELPLMPGTYWLDLYFGSRGPSFDVVYNAGELTTVPDDVFGTGRAPTTDRGAMCWPATWER